MIIRAGLAIWKRNWAAVETALKDLNQLGKDVAGAEETHPGSTPKKFDEKAQKLAEKAEAVRSKGPEVLGKAKNKRDQVLQEQADMKKAAKQAVRDKKEMNKAYNDLRRVDRQQDQQVQKKHVELGRKGRRHSAPEIQQRSKEQAQIQPQFKKGTVKRNATTDDLDKLQQPVKKKSLSRSKSGNSGLSGKKSWTPEDQALENRLRKIKGLISHETITSSGNPKSFAQLEKQLHSISSIKDLKALVADRRASKITIGQQRRYLGLLNAVVQGMSKNSDHAKKMNESLIKDVLKEQPSEARVAIKSMHNSITDALQRRLDRLKRDD